MEQKLPEKKMPSTAANATMRSAKLPFSIHSRAQLAFSFTQSRVSIALKSLSFSALSLMYVSISSEYVSLWMFSIMIWKP